MCYIISMPQCSGFMGFYEFNNEEIICHSQWVKMKTNELIIKIMNTFDQGKGVEGSGMELVCEIVTLSKRIDETKCSEKNVSKTTG